MNEMRTYPQVSQPLQSSLNIQQNRNLEDRRRSSIIRRHRIRSHDNDGIIGNPKKRKILIYLITAAVLMIIGITLVSYYLISDQISSSANAAIDYSNLIKMPCNELFKKTQASYRNAEITQLEANLHDSKKHLSIYLVTWNVAGKAPSQPFRELFAFDHRLYDVYAIALEEVPYKSMMWSDEWTTEMEKVFHNRGYVLLKKESIFVTQVMVFVKKQDILKFSDVKSHSARIVNRLTMKGGIGIRFKYENVKIGFLGAHLTPHDENYHLRIKDYRSLMADIYFGDDTFDNVANQDFSFIFGDLNFRLNPLMINNRYDEAEEYNYIVRFIERNFDNDDPERYEPLLKFDQIRHARIKREAFVGYEESKITFAPTFKHVIGTCNYDPKRRPAWTDRILHRNQLKFQKSSPPLNNEEKDREQSSIDPIMLHYDSLPLYKDSDHKPVRQVAWIPILGMKLVKRDLLQLRSRRRRGRKSISKDEENLPLRPRLASDSAVKSPRSANENEERISPDDINRINDNPDQIPDFESYWPNIDDPDLFEPKYRIEFYHIPNWCETKKFVAYFRVVEVIEMDDTENGTTIKTRPVSINSPSVKRFLSQWDWVGLFPESFTSLENFLTYSYPRFGTSIVSEEAHDALSMLSISNSTNVNDGTAGQQQQQQNDVDEATEEDEEEDTIGSRHSPQGDDHPRKKRKEKLQSKSETESLTEETTTTTSSPSTSTSNLTLSSTKTTTITDNKDEDQDINTNNTGNDDQDSSLLHSPSTSSNTEDILSVYFDENCPILAGRYQLIYVRMNGDVIGISEPFEIEHNLDLSSDIGFAPIADH